MADAYDPVLLEVLEWFAAAPAAEHDGASTRRAAADDRGTAVRRPRAVRVGAATSPAARRAARARRVNPDTYDGDPTLGRLVRVVPFGLPDRPPHRTGAAPLRRPGLLGPDDFVLLWGGGMHQWLDPLVLVEAVARIDDPAVKAVFLGGSHPTPGVPGMPVADEARARARGPRGPRVPGPVRRPLGAVRRAGRLPARRRRRGLAPPQPPRGGLRLPDPHARLPLGRSPGRVHPRRLLRGARRGAGSARSCRPATPMPSPSVSVG